MSACLKCGHDPSARILASWTLRIPRRVNSGNAHVFNVGAARFAYRKERDAWERDFRALRRHYGIPVASGFRRVTLTRQIGHRQRAYDRDNLATGCKPIVDAMVRAGLLVDDAAKSAEIHYGQVKAGEAGLVVVVEEVEA